MARPLWGYKPLSTALSIGKTDISQRLTQHDGAIGALLQTEEGRRLVDDYRRFRLLTQASQPETSTWAPRLYFSERGVVAPPVDFHQGANAISAFLSELQKNPVPEKEWPSIHFFEEVQPLLFDTAGSGHRDTRSFLEEKSTELFGVPLSLEDLLAGFAVDLPGYRLSQLNLEFIGRNNFDIRGSIASIAGGPEVAAFHRSIPARPPEGTTWIARSFGIAVADDSLQRQGIGRLLTQRFLALLAKLGVDALDFSVSNAGAFVFPRLGFDFARPEARDRIKIRFREFLKAKFPHRALMDDVRWARIEHAWEVSRFRLTDGYPAGCDFLFELGERGRTAAYPVRFLTKPDYEGWGLLFSERTPPEWQGLAPDTLNALRRHHRDEMPQLLTSFRAHVGNLHEALGNWIFPVDFYLKNRGPDGLLHMMSAEEVRELHEQFIHTAQLLAWMSAAEMRATDLGRAFWATLSSEARSMIPKIAAAARELLGIEVERP